MKHLKNFTKKILKIFQKWIFYLILNICVTFAIKVLNKIKIMKIAQFIADI